MIWLYSPSILSSSTDWRIWLLHKQLPIQAYLILAKKDPMSSLNSVDKCNITLHKILLKSLFQSMDPKIHSTVFTSPSILILTFPYDIKSLWTIPKTILSSTKQRLTYWPHSALISCPILLQSPVLQIASDMVILFLLTRLVTAPFQPTSHKKSYTSIFHTAKLQNLTLSSVYILTVVIISCLS